MTQTINSISYNVLLACTLILKVQMSVYLVLKTTTVLILDLKRLKLVQWDTFAMVNQVIQKQISRNVQLATTVQAEQQIWTFLM